MPTFDSVDGAADYQSSFERFVSHQSVKTYTKRRPFGRTPSRDIEPILERLDRLSPKKSRCVVVENTSIDRRRSAPILGGNGLTISPPLADKFGSIIQESENEAKIDDEKTVVDCSRRRSARSANKRTSTDEVFDSFACMADKSESESIAGSEKMAAASKNDVASESSQDSGFGSQDSRDGETKVIKLVYVPKSIEKTVDANFNSRNGLRRSTRPKSSASSEDDNLPLSVLAAKTGIRQKNGKVSISEPDYIVSDSSMDGMNLHDLIQARANEIFTKLDMVEKRSSPRKATEIKVPSVVPSVSPAKDASVSAEKAAEPETTKTDNILQNKKESTGASAEDLPTGSTSVQNTDDLSAASHLRSIQLKNKRKTPPKAQKSGSENALPTKSPKNTMKYKRFTNFLPFKEKMRRLRIAEAEAAERRALLASKNAANVAGDTAQESCPDSVKEKSEKLVSAASLPKTKPGKATKRKFDGNSCESPKSKRRKTGSDLSVPVLKSTQATGTELKIANSGSLEVTMTIATSNTDQAKVDVGTPLEIITTPEKLGEVESPAVSPNGTRRKHSTPKKLTDYDCRRRKRSSLGASYHNPGEKTKPKVKKEAAGKKRYSGFYAEGEPYNIMFRLIKQRNSLAKEELDLNQNDNKSS